MSGYFDIHGKEPLIRPRSCQKQNYICNIEIALDFIYEFSIKIRKKGYKYLCIYISLNHRREFRFFSKGVEETNSWG